MLRSLRYCANHVKAVMLIAASTKRNRPKVRETFLTYSDVFYVDTHCCPGHCCPTNMYALSVDRNMFRIWQTKSCLH